MIFDFLIFDLDGTIVDSKADIASSVNAVREEYGLKHIPVDTVRSYLGNDVNALMEYAVRGVVYEKEKITKSDIIAKFKFYYWQRLTDTTFVFDGIKDMLEILKNKNKAILSNKNEDFSCEIIRRLGISNYFIKIWGGDTISVKKPDPKPILDLIRLTNSDISKTVMIGDSANDFLAAKNAGIQSIAVLYGYSDQNQIEKCNPNFIVKTPKDIIDIVS